MPATPKEMCPKCGSTECLGEVECVSRQVTKYVIELLIKAHGQEVADFWVWEMTPMPCGFPSDAQLGKGLRMAFATRMSADEDRAKHASAIDAALKSAQLR